MATRPYTQVARAEATDRTRRAALEAAQSLFAEERNFDASLEQIADRAGTSTRTLLRHFGSKEGLIEAAIADAGAAVVESRRAPAGDVGAAIAKLVDHYEEMGDDVIGMLAETDRRPVVKRVVENGKRIHREWVKEIFAAELDGLGGGERARLTAVLATVTDVYVWALLRRREGLSRKQTESAIKALVERSIGEPR